MCVYVMGVGGGGKGLKNECRGWEFVGGIWGHPTLEKFELTFSRRYFLLKSFRDSFV